MNSPFTIEERKYANDINKLARHADDIRDLVKAIEENTAATKEMTEAIGCPANIRVLLSDISDYLHDDLEGVCDYELYDKVNSLCERIDDVLNK